MATVDSKEIIDAIITGDGLYPGDRVRAVKIVAYTNVGGRTSYGVVYEGERDTERYERVTEFIRDPHIIWQARG